MKQIKDTDKSKNLSIAIYDDITLDQMERELTKLGLELGLVISHITTLSRKKYPGNRHWHFKQDLKANGCLDVTYWPKGTLFWITMRNYEPDWVHKAGRDLAALVERNLNGAD